MGCVGRSRGLQCELLQPQNRLLRRLALVDVAQMSLMYAQRSDIGSRALDRRRRPPTFSPPSIFRSGKSYAFLSTFVMRRKCGRVLQEMAVQTARDAKTIPYVGGEQVKK